MIGGDKDNPQFEDNEPVPIYDTSGPYGDPVSELNVHKGLSAPWISERADTVPVENLSSDFTQQRLADAGLDHLRFNNRPTIKPKLTVCYSITLCT